jgi:putative transposase
MAEYRKDKHTVYNITYHYVWVTKYRYHVLKGDVALRARDLIRQTCLSRGVTILKGNVGKDHVHILVSCLPSLSPSKIMQYIKGRSSRMLQDEFPHLKKRYWGKHLWTRGYFCATVGTVTEEMIRQYIENQPTDGPEDAFQVNTTD